MTDDHNDRSYPEDGKERGDEIPKHPPQCEGRMVPYAHKEDAVEYQLYDKEGNKDTKGFLCSECALDDIRKGYDWRIIPGQFVHINHYRDMTFEGIEFRDNGFTFYPNSEE